MNQTELLQWGSTFLTIVGIVDLLFIGFALASALFLWSRGVFSVLLPLGRGLANRKIAIFAKESNLRSLGDLLKDSQLFKADNVLLIGSINDIGKAEKASVFLVHWHDFAEYIDQIIQNKKDQFPLVVYAPYNQGRIPDDQMVKLDGKRNTAVTNFRGRLLNDVLTAMMTTNYDQGKD